MMKILRKGVILLVIFVAVVAGTSFLMNSQSTDNRSDMNDATLPEVMVKIGSTQANKMYGYRQQMQTDFMRGSITPLDTTKKVSFEINPYADTVTGLAYEVRTSDGSKVMENRKIKNLTKEDNGCLSTEIEIGSDLRMNQEYSMQITLDTSEGEVYYYTRVVSRTQLNTEAYLQFVKDFSTKCLDKEQADTLTGYLEAEDTSGGTNYNNISISSGLSNIISMKRLQVSRWIIRFPHRMMRVKPKFMMLRNFTVCVIQKQGSCCWILNVLQRRYLIRLRR